MRSSLLSLLLLLGACLAGCAPASSVQWMYEDVHPVAVHGDRRLERARIWTRDTVMQWRAVLITADSISGIPEQRPQLGDSCRVALATSVVDSLQVGYSSTPNPTIDLPGDTSKSAKVMMMADADLTVNPGGGSVDVGGHLSWKTPIHLGLDGAIATSLLGGTYDFADGDISIDAIPLFAGITLAPRVGLSSVIVNENTAFNGTNVGVAFRRRTGDGGFFRVDAVYRRVGGYVFSTIAVGTEFSLGKKK